MQAGSSGAPRLCGVLGCADTVTLLESKRLTDVPARV